MASRKPSKRAHAIGVLRRPLTISERNGMLQDL